MPLTPTDQDLLRGIATRSIREGLHGKPWAPPLDALPEPLRAKGAAFVTLELHGDLRGCIGSLKAHRALATDVAANAFAAAFKDPRFDPVTAAEAPELDIHLSVLAPPEPLPVDSEAHLLVLLKPRLDGLILELGEKRATFLPSVWDDLPKASEFVDHLKAKAGQIGRAHV